MQIDWTDFANSPALLVAVSERVGFTPGPRVDYTLKTYDALYAAAAAAHAGDGRLPIWRGIRVVRLRDVHWDNIGACWSFVETSAHPMHGAHLTHRERHGGDAVLTDYRLHGSVKLADVDWTATARLIHDIPQEREVRLLPGALVEIHGISHWARGAPGRQIVPVKRSFRARVDENERWDCWVPRRR